MPTSEILPASGTVPVLIGVPSIPRTLPVAWLVLVGGAGIEAVWARSASLSVTGWFPVACIALLLMTAGALCHRSDRWSEVGDMTDAAGTWIAFTALGCVLTYLSARNTLPLRDDAFEALDRRMGFDWVAWSAWVAMHPAVQAVLRLAYASLSAQIVVCCCVLPLTGGARRLSELFWGALLAILVTSAVSALLPALGAYAHYGLIAQADWLTDLLALRQPGSVTVTLHQMKGLVAFPSYHAVLAVLFVHAHRRTGGIGLAIAALNLVMIASTPSEGSHYLSDVIAGIVVAAGSIMAVRHAPGPWLQGHGRIGGAASPSAVGKRPRAGHMPA